MVVANIDIDRYQNGTPIAAMFWAATDNRHRKRLIQTLKKIVLVFHAILYHVSTSVMLFNVCFGNEYCSC